MRQYHLSHLQADNRHLHRLHRYCPPNIAGNQLMSQIRQLPNRYHHIIHSTSPHQELAYQMFSIRPYAIHIPMHSFIFLLICIIGKMYLNVCCILPNITFILSMWILWATNKSYVWRISINRFRGICYAFVFCNEFTSIFIYLINLFCIFIDIWYNSGIIAFVSPYKAFALLSFIITAVRYMCALCVIISPLKIIKI